MEFHKAQDIKDSINDIVKRINLPHLNAERIFCFRSFGSKSRAIARIWSLPKIWQMGLDTQAHYCIEVISQRFDRLSEEDKIRVLIHELLHIPKNFSGALLPHKSRWKNGINRRTIEEIFKQYKKG